MNAAVLSLLLLSIPPFQRGFEERYVAAIGPEFGQAVAVAKCDLCHAGTSKKQRNEYGQALDRVLDKERFTFERLKADPLGARRELLAALKSVEDKRASDGQTFAQRISAGLLPSP